MAVAGFQFEGAIIRLLDNWKYYAEVHRLKYGSPIGEDYVLGVYWLDMAHAIHGLLDGETGRLDCGTLSTFIMETCKENGLDYEKDHERHEREAR